MAKIFNSMAFHREHTVASVASFLFPCPFCKVLAVQHLGEKLYVGEAYVCNQKNPSTKPQFLPAHEKVQVKFVKKLPAMSARNSGNSESFSWVSFRKLHRKCAFFSMVSKNALQNGRWCQAKTDLTKDDAKGKQTEMSGNISNEKGFKRKTACCEMMMVDFWGEKVVKRHVTTMPREREESDVKEGCDTESSYLHTRTHTHTHILSYLTVQRCWIFFPAGYERVGMLNSHILLFLQSNLSPPACPAICICQGSSSRDNKPWWVINMPGGSEFLLQNCSIILSLAHSCRCWARGKIAWVPCS